MGDGEVHGAGQGLVKLLHQQTLKAGLHIGEFRGGKCVEGDIGTRSLSGHDRAHIKSPYVLQVLHLFKVVLDVCGHDVRQIVKKRQVLALGCGMEAEEGAGRFRAVLGGFGFCQFQRIPDVNQGLDDPTDGGFAGAVIAQNADQLRTADPALAQHVTVAFAQ